MYTKTALMLGATAIFVLAANIVALHLIGLWASSLIGSFHG